MMKAEDKVHFAQGRYATSTACGITLYSRNESGYVESVKYTRANSKAAIAGMTCEECKKIAERAA